jgi:hypothetical protein
MREPWSRPDGVELTSILAASAEDVAALDAVRYVDGGPRSEDIRGDGGAE